MNRHAVTAAALLSLALAGCGATPGDTPDAPPAPTIEQTTDAPADTTTPGQENALRSAQSYIDTLGMSRDSLIRQLGFEKYSVEDSTYAADHVTVDWNAEAAQSAQNYIDTMAFSHDGLVSQLVAEGFTPDQAEYGVTAVGL